MLVIVSEKFSLTIYNFISSFIRCDWEFCDIATGSETTLRRRLHCRSFDHGHNVILFIECCVPIQYNINMKDTKERTMSGSSTMLSNEYTVAFSSINERPVDDISLEFFYKPHTITLLAVSIASVIYTAFVRY